MALHNDAEYEIAGYRLDNEEREKEFILKGVKAEDLLSIFPEGESTELVMIYPISEAQARQLAQRYGFIFDFSKYDYFLECFAK